MNVFFLDKTPTTCAQYHNDKHVVKMVIEYAQLLSTAHRVLDGQQYWDKTKNGRRIKRYRMFNKYLDTNLYLAAHVNHPSASGLVSPSTTTTGCSTSGSLCVRSMSIDMVVNI